MTNEIQPWRGQVNEDDIASAIHAVRLSQTRLSDVVAVVGDGALALATVAVLLARGVGDVVLVAEDGECAREAIRVGANVLSPPASAEALDQVRTRLGGYGADFVFGCEGRSEARRLAIEIVRPAGMVVLMAHDAATTSMNPNLLVFADKRVQGSGHPNSEDLHIARDFIKAGRLHIRGPNPDRTGRAFNPFGGF